MRHLVQRLAATSFPTPGGPLSVGTAAHALLADVTADCRNPLCLVSVRPLPAAPVSVLPTLDVHESHPPLVPSS